MKALIKALLLASAFGLLMGCSPVKLPNVSSYELSNLKAVKSSNRSRTQITLSVNAPTAAPGYQSAAMIYMITPYQLSSFTLHKWVAPPAQMMLPIIVMTLRSKGYYKAVVSGVAPSLTQYNLDLQLIKLQQEFLQPKSRIRMVMQATLFNNLTNKVVASRRFTQVVPANTNTPYGGVLAANRVANTVAQQIARFCIRNS